ncbi:MAG: hypothetical protein ACHQNT_10125 [Bacteroidia bacterium]
MKKLFFGLAGISLLALCCNSNYDNSDSKDTTQKVVSVFSGNWISRNYIDSLYKYGSPKKANESPLEMVISFAADSLCLFNFDGENKVFLITDVTDTSFSVQNFNEEEITEFYLSANKRELSYAGSNNKRFAFQKIEPKYAVKSIDGWKSAFEIYFNEMTIAANYFLLNTENKPGSEVAFTSYGQVIGLAKYKSYKICYGGDCLKKSGDDIIELSDAETTDEYICQWEDGTLLFYSITNISKTNEPPVYIKGPAIFRFKKNM